MEENKCCEHAKVKNHHFAVHKLNEIGMDRAKQIQQTFDDCLNTLKGICPEGRSLAICETKLEEACFFAKKAMAINLDNHDID
jgi:hypothetical protein